MKQNFDFYYKGFYLMTGFKNIIKYDANEKPKKTSNKKLLSNNNKDQNTVLNLKPDNSRQNTTKGKNKGGRPSNVKNHGSFVENKKNNPVLMAQLAAINAKQKKNILYNIQEDFTKMDSHIY